MEDAISGCLFPLTSLIPVSPHSGERAGARAAAERGIEADPGGPSSSLSQSPSIIGILEIFTRLPALWFFFKFLLVPPSMHFHPPPPPPLKSSSKWQFFDQSYSRQLPTAGWLTTPGPSVLQASPAAPTRSWLWFFQLFTAGCGDPSHTHHSFPVSVILQLMVPELVRVPANVFPGSSFSTQRSHSGSLPSLSKYFCISPSTDIIAEPTRNSFLPTIHFQPFLLQNISEGKN